LALIWEKQRCSSFFELRSLFMAGLSRLKANLESFFKIPSQPGSFAQKDVLHVLNTLIQKH
jgi:hypothetical protein